MELIDKAAILAEIERLKKKNKKSEYVYDSLDTEYTLTSITSFINTLEAKEVNLEKEIDLAMPSKYCWSGDGEAVYTKEQMRNFAKHFFELGLKAQKGE